MANTKDISCTAHIKKMSTGEVRQYDSEIWGDGDGPDPYIWSEGNWSCDCNRHDFFNNSGPVTADGTSDYVCGESEYKVKLEVDGKFIYEEW